MPTASKRWRKLKANLLAKRAAFLARRPHHSFKLTRRRDHSRQLSLPGYLLFTHEVFATLWRHKRIFGTLALIYAGLYAILVGATSQETYSSLSGTIDEASDQVGEELGVFSKAGALFLSVASSSVSATPSDGQQIFSVLLGLMVWLTTIWLLRNILAGHKVVLRDGLYNAGAPILASVLIVLFIVIQLIPAAIAGIGYGAAQSSGLLNGGIEAALFWAAAGLLCVLSLYWVTSSLIAMIIITLPGMYPLKALQTGGDLVVGRRVRLLLRLQWMFVVIIASWTVILLPTILFDLWAKSVIPAINWFPLVPIVLVFLTSVTVIWATTYVYLLYRKVVEND